MCWVPEKKKFNLIKALAWLKFAALFTCLVFSGFGHEKKAEAQEEQQANCKVKFVKQAGASLLSLWTWMPSRESCKKLAEPNGEASYSESTSTSPSSQDLPTQETPNE